MKPNEPGPSRLVDYFEYIGTRDLAPFLAVPVRHRVSGAPPLGEQFAAKPTHLARDCLAQLTALTGLVPLYAPDSDWFAQMVTIPLPPQTDRRFIKIPPLR